MQYSLAAINTPHQIFACYCILHFGPWIDRLSNFCHYFPYNSLWKWLQDFVSGTPAYTYYILNASVYIRLSLMNYHVDNSLLINGNRNAVRIEQFSHFFFFTSFMLCTQLGEGNLHTCNTFTPWCSNTAPKFRSACRIKLVKKIDRAGFQIDTFELKIRPIRLLVLYRFAQFLVPNNAHQKYCNIQNNTHQQAHYDIIDTVQEVSM